MSETPRSSKERLTGWLADLLVCLRFCTRVPIPRFEFEAPAEEASIAASAAMLPAAGAVIGTAAALVFWLAARLGLPTSLAALVAVAALIVLTGALHEDGLADFADALGGATPEARLAIMKDSRLGSFGCLALTVSLLTRVMALAVLAEQSLGLAASVLIAAGASSRCFALLPLQTLKAARNEGLGAAAGQLKDGALLTAAVATLVANLIPLLAGASLVRVSSALILSGVAAYGTVALARRLLQGQTGDVAGAVQQIGEMASYLAFASQL